MTPHLQTTLAPIFPASQFDICQQNVSNARIFVVMAKLPELQDKLYDAFREKLDLQSLNANETITEDQRAETKRYAENLVKLFVAKLYDTTLSVDQICEWVRGVYQSEEKLPYFYAKNKETGVEMIVTKVSDSVKAEGDGAAMEETTIEERYDPHLEL